MRADHLDEWMRRYWDEDAPTYDRSPGHATKTSAQRAAWMRVLRRLLPAPPARVLDAGAGTGFLSVPLAELGYQVTALDLSPGMLAHLRTRAEAANLELEVVEGSAESPPPGPFDVVVERLLLWTVADPIAALRAWRSVAPGGQLVSFGTVWGGADRVEIWRERARSRLHRLRRRPPEHHALYDQEVVDRLPCHGAGVPPAEVVDALEAAGWTHPELERLRDVEWTRSLMLGPFERALGVPHEFAVIAKNREG
jgi:SAM-dependent methyltransferase